MDPSPNGTPTLLKIKGRSYAAGIFWQASKDPKNLIAEAKETAESEDISADLIVYRKQKNGQGPSQYGLGRKIEGLRAGSISAAAVAADVRPGTWMGVFEAGNDGYWFVAVRDDYIEPNGDAFYYGQAEAKERFDREKRSNWERIYAPEEWISQEQDNRIINILENSNILDVLGNAKSPKLQSAKSSSLTIIGLAILLVLIVGGGVGWWIDYQDKAEKERLELERLEREEELRRKIRPIIINQPWPDFVKTAEYTKSCLDGLRRIPTALPGYEIASMECGEQNATASYRRDTGHSGWAEGFFRNMARGLVGNVAPNGEIANISIRFEPLTKRGDEAIFRANDIARAFAERAAFFGDGLTWGTVNLTYPPNATEQQIASGAVQAAPWGMIEFRVETYARDGWIELFNATPGLRLKSINYNNTTTRWTFSGETYVIR